ncbi:hypothetical protein Tco_0724156 [Tanacetum coccineum]
MDCPVGEVAFFRSGSESGEARLLVYKKNESVYEEDIKLLKREIYLKEVAITVLRRKLELAQKQKDEIKLTVEKLENSSKILSKLIDFTAAKLMLLVQKLLLLVLKVNVAGIKVTTAERLQLLEEFMLTEKRSKTYQRKDNDCLKIKITYEIRIVIYRIDL